MSLELEEGDWVFVSKVSKINRFPLIYFKVPNHKEAISIRV
ncbi:hypothetical protein IW492_13775 [Enterococcus sp. BWB1-3]|nr:hypothetical protein [Enterococcus sp. BWB1-3]